PENGNLMVNAELLPLSSDEFETGPPSIDAIELARIMDRSVRESQALDTADLCVEPGEKVWSIMCDICTINDAGNLFDAASIALISALKSARFPSLDEGKVDYKKKTETPLPITKIPLGITVWKVGDKFIVDPLKVEQRAMDARLTVGTLDDGTICALQKGGEGTLSVEDIAAMIDLSIDHADSIRKIIKKTIGE
ncbi:MAG: RNA-binding protein, partial [Nanoarchaeota archaeon]